MIVEIIGFTGMGKSTLAHFVARRCPTRVVIDPRGQFHTSEVILPNEVSLYERLDDTSEIIIRPGWETEVSECFDRVCRVIARWIRDNPQEEICFIVDEARIVGLDSRNVSLSFDWIMRSAREGSPITVVITCHRPTDLHTNIRAIANRIVLFRVTLPNDLESIEEQCGPRVTAEVEKLLDKEFVTWNNSRQQWRKINDPASWYVRIDQEVAA